MNASGLSCKASDVEHYGRRGSARLHTSGRGRRQSGAPTGVRGYDARHRIAPTLPYWEFVDGPIGPFNRLELKKKKIEVAAARPYRAVACEKLS